MRVAVSRGAKCFAFCWDPPVPPEVSSREAARDFLRHIGRDALAMQALRMVARATGIDVRGANDERVIDELVQLHLAGRLRVRRVERERHASSGIASGPAPAAARRAPDWIIERRAPVAAAPEPEGREDVDQAAQAKALLAAAASGVPFCEECAKKAVRKAA